MIHRRYLSQDDIFQESLTHDLSMVVVEPADVTAFTKPFHDALVSGLAGFSDPRLGIMMGKLYDIRPDEILRIQHLNRRSVSPAEPAASQSGQTASASDSSPQKNE